MNLGFTLQAKQQLKKLVNEMAIEKFEKITGVSLIFNELDSIAITIASNNLVMAQFSHSTKVVISKMISNTPDLNDTSLRYAASVIVDSFVGREYELFIAKELKNKQ